MTCFADVHVLKISFLRIYLCSLLKYLSNIEILTVGGLGLGSLSSTLTLTSSVKVSVKVTGDSTFPSDMFEI